MCSSEIFSYRLYYMVLREIDGRTKHCRQIFISASDYYVDSKTMFLVRVMYAYDDNGLNGFVTKALLCGWSYAWK